MAVAAPAPRPRARLRKAPPPRRAVRQRVAPTGQWLAMQTPRQLAVRERRGRRRPRGAAAGETGLSSKDAASWRAKACIISGGRRERHGHYPRSDRAAPRGPWSSRRRCSQFFRHRHRLVVVGFSWSAAARALVGPSSTRRGRGAGRRPRPSGDDRRRRRASASRYQAHTRRAPPWLWPRARRSRRAGPGTSSRQTLPNWPPRDRAARGASARRPWTRCAPPRASRRRRRTIWRRASRAACFERVPAMAQRAEADASKAAPAQQARVVRRALLEGRPTVLGQSIQQRDGRPVAGVAQALPEARGLPQLRAGPFTIADGRVARLRR